MQYIDFQAEVAQLLSTFPTDPNAPQGISRHLLRLLAPDQAMLSPNAVGRRLAEAGGLIWNLCLSHTAEEQRHRLSNHAIGLVEAGLQLAPDYDLIWGKLGIMCTISLRFDEACAAFNKATSLRESQNMGLTTFEKAYASVSFMRTGEVTRARALATEASLSDELPEGEQNLVDTVLRQSR
jgi:uncharacterized protein HemY